MIEYVNMKISAPMMTMMMKPQQKEMTNAVMTLMKVMTSMVMNSVANAERQPLMRILVMMIAVRMMILSNVTKAVRTPPMKVMADQRTILNMGMERQQSSSMARMVKVMVTKHSKEQPSLTS